MTKEKPTGSEVKIRVSGLSNGLHEYHFSAEPSVIGLEPNFRSPVEIDVRLDKITRQMFLRTVIHTSGQFQCDRCLDEFNQRLSTEYSMFYTYDEIDATKYPEDEVTILQPDQVFIDATEDVRQMVMLAVPLKLLCREACKGLCPHCGANWNSAACKCEEETIDPRWESLQGLIDN
ncbi:MAG: DUF177 domain-containing protein [Ignavibacteriae bacterium]|nr:DUF177 domain-containing protein [Ignavibacteria bacterium]MBI3364385.1 DUF177 domain-containing protein [Ignavibacteriota bacterium]